jgi:hypothetical protein
MTLLAEPSTHVRPRGRSTAWWVVGALLVAVVAGYLIGAHRPGDTTRATGVGYVGDKVVTIRTPVDDWAYGFSGSVPWIDRDGTSHEGGWPACLTPLTQVTVTFGWVPVTYPDGSTARQVAYVDCSA